MEKARYKFLIIIIIIKPCYSVSLTIFRSWGGGRGVLTKFWFIHFFLKNEETNVLGMEETRFTTDHSQDGND